MTRRNVATIARMSPPSVEPRSCLTPYLGASVSCGLRRVALEQDCVCPSFRLPRIGEPRCPAAHPGQRRLGRTDERDEPGQAVMNDHFRSIAQNYDEPQRGG